VSAPRGSSEIVVAEARGAGGARGGAGRVVVRVARGRGGAGGAAGPRSASASASASASGPARSLDARVAVSIADPRLARKVARAVAARVREAAAAVAGGATAPLPPEGLSVVRVTERNARRLVAIVGALRAGGALGVQLVWDGADPPRDRVERHVFAVLEHARATPGEAPVVLAASPEPVLALRLLAARRRPSPAVAPRDADEPDEPDGPDEPAALATTRKDLGR
jgi:hypothetical protein